MRVIREKKLIQFIYPMWNRIGPMDRKFHFKKSLGADYLHMSFEEKHISLSMSKVIQIIP